MNEKAIYKAQESNINSLTEKLEKANDSILSLNNEIADLNYFALQGNDNAMTYLENLGYDAKEVEKLISNSIYEQNITKGGNPLVPFEGINGIMKVNKLKFLNHKWILADFTDGKYWGEMILEYSFNDENELQLNTISSLLYPAN